MYDVGQNHEVQIGLFAFITIESLSEIAGAMVTDTCVLRTD